MLTNNFTKMLFILGGNVTTATTTSGTTGTMYAITPYNQDTASSSIGYGVGESTWLFTDETVAPDKNTWSRSEYDRSIINAFYPDTTSSYSNYYHGTLAMLVGTGTTAATVNDYKLESQIVLNSSRDFCIWDADTYSFLLGREFKNDTEDSVSVSEIGLYYISGELSSTANIFLVGRQVLTTPVVMAIGEHAVFTYNVDFSQAVG